MKHVEKMTNEQAKADMCCQLYCIDCEIETEMCEAGEHTVRDYAADLLAARAERDRAEAMVKLLRDFINSCPLENIEDVKDREALMIYTEDYAE